MGSFKKKNRQAQPEGKKLSESLEKRERRKRENEPVMINRELSWLKFNERVLEEAEDERVPLCERLNFASIYQSNLDEFFMVRMGTLVDQELVTPKVRENKTYMTPREQIDALLRRVRELGTRRDAAYLRLLQALEGQGGGVVDFRRIARAEGERLERYFDARIAPMVTPILVEQRQPFPFLQGKLIYAIAVLQKKGGKGTRLGIVSCEPLGFSRLIEVAPQAKRYILAEELILHFLGKLFPGYYVKEKSLVRVTRNADIDADALYDEDDDYREFMASLMKRRKRLHPVRVELSSELDEKSLALLCRNLHVKRRFVLRSATPMDLSFLTRFGDELRQVPELFYERRSPQRSPLFEAGRPVYDQVREGDKLLSYPYESMKPMLDLLEEAADDPTVVSVKMTLYRVARQSKVVEALIEAAENGKEVLVLVELKARFDEENNIEWSRRLEEAGCTVIYGLDGIKVHSKLCLITRMIDGQTVYTTQIGTGNYNEKTARIYTDYCLMTCDPGIGEDAAQVFSALAMGETPGEQPRLLVAPHGLQNRVLEKMDEQIRRALMGEEAWIGVKINSLTDRAIIEKLIEASRAGVQVELIVRGICCLLPGVPGWTENIRIRSIVGRYLEHSRVYLFGKGPQAEVYLSSADFMTRNTLRRVEVATPVHDPAIKARVQQMFETMLRDDVQARELRADGAYERLRPETGEGLCSQGVFYREAYAAAGTKLPNAQADDANAN